MGIAKNPKVIMTSKQLVERLKVLAARKTFYKNKYPYNLCYINKDGRTSADCVNLMKALLNGYDVNNNTYKYYQENLSNTGDCTEEGLLCQCSDVSENFSELDNRPRILYMYSPNRHIGCYLGEEVNIGGKLYNVIECCKSWNGIVYSWVDNDGTRRRYKGSAKNCKWLKHGLPTPWVSMVEAEKPAEPVKPKDPEPVPEPTQTVYYVKSGDTMTSIAKKFGMSLAKLVSYNPQIKDINKISVGQKIYLTSQTKEEYYVVQKGDTLGNIARKFNMSLNKLLGLNPDIKNPNLIHPGDKIRIK